MHHYNSVLFTLELSDSVYESKGYEEFADLTKYGEPRLPDLLDWIIYKVS